MFSAILANMLAVHSTTYTHPGSDPMSRLLRKSARNLYWGIAALDTAMSHSQWLNETCCQKGCPTDIYPALFKLIPAAYDERYDGLIVDPANFCICYATSYCAYRIKQSTGHWPTKPVIPKNAAHATEIASRERKHDAKYWVEFLEAQGYDQITRLPQPGHHYIGVDPEYGKYGLVVWLEGLFQMACDNRVKATVSTYEDKKYVRKEVELSEFLWVEIR